MSQGVIKLVFPVGRVDMDQDRANSRNSELKEDPFDPIGAPDPDAIAGANAVGDQRARGGVDCGL